MIKLFVCTVLLVVFLMNSTDGARILGMFPMPVKSHMITHSAYLKGLADAGHQVVVFSPFPQEKPYPNYTDVVINVTYADLLKGTDLKNWFEEKSGWNFHLISTLWNVGHKLCHISFQHEFLQNLINNNDEHYDLLVVGSFFYDCLMGLGPKLKIPIVQLASFGGTRWMHEWMGNPSPYSYIPDLFLPYTDRMNFWQRFINTYSELRYKIGRQIYYLPQQNEIMQHYLSDGNNFPTIYDLEKNISLLLVNSHFSISFPRPLTPNVVQVGGLHVKPPKKLPPDLQKYLDDAPHGVIYFSMGSNLRSSNLPEATRDAFLKAFSKLKQKVLWKWETDSLPGQPKNVKLGKWLPQSDVLAHPNVKLFITHGGLLSTQETIDRGVPVIGIPIYGDQYMNMANTVSLGIGVKLELSNISMDSVLWAINEILDNPRYTNNIQRISRTFRDQPLTPLQTAIFWTEYVIRHKGAPHMRPASLDLTWYQYFLLDVIAVLTIATGIVLFITFILLRAVYRILCGSSTHKKGISSKKRN